MIHEDRSTTEVSSVETAVVLVAATDAAVAATVRDRLPAEWRVEVTHDDVETVAAYGPHVDVVLCDRPLAGRPVEETIAAIRDRPGVCCVVTVDGPTAAPVGSAVDAHVETPFDGETLVETVTRLARLVRHIRELRALFELGARAAELEVAYPSSVLGDQDRHRRIHRELDRLAALAAARRAVLGEEEHEDPFSRALAVVGDDPATELRGGRPPPPALE